MSKNKISASNIQENHTIGEYQRYFSHLLKKGKLKRFSLKEKKKLDPKRQYWKITDGKGETYYYELPKYIKAGSSKTAYSMKRVMHRRPVRVALAIFAGVAALSFTSSIVTRKVFAPSYPDVPPADLNELQEKLLKYQNWAKDHPGEDVSKSSEFTVSDLSNAAMASALYDSNSYTKETGYARRPLLAVGYGSTNTIALKFIPVNVDIRNAFTYKNGSALEESVSYSDDMFAPKFGRRDFYTNSDESVNSNLGAATSTSVTWQDNYDRHYSKNDYIQQVGKNPDSPFLYTINENTVLNTSTVEKITIDQNDGYQIKINLDKIEGVANYLKRINYLSGKSASNFSQVDLTLITNSNLVLKSFSVNEKYIVTDTFAGECPTTGKLTTKFYYEDVPDIPSRTDEFDYSKYPA